LIAGCGANIPQSEDWTPIGTYRIYVEAVSGNLETYTTVDLVVR